MKKIIFFLLLLIPFTSLFSQQTETKHALTKEDYLAKSKRQKTGAWVLLGGGTALMGAAVLIGSSKEVSFGDAGAAVIMGGLGFLCDLGSIPLFIASGKNKRRGMKASASLIMQNAYVLQKQNNSIMPFPALSLKVRL